MTSRPRLLLLLCGLVPVLAASALALLRPSLLTPLEYRAYDVLVRSAEMRPQSGRVVIVDVDERSLSAIGQWPWRRDVVAGLVTRLREMGASVVALDIIFAEPDRTGGVDADAALAGALAGGRVVIGYAMTFESASAAACSDRPFPLAIIRADDETEESFFRAKGSICSLPVLSEAAGASGFLNAAPDPDGLLRRAPLLLEHGGRVYPALALAAVAVTTGSGSAALRVSNVNSASLAFGSRRVPLDGKSNMLLRYRGAKRSFPYLSAADVLAGRVPAGAVRDKVVFVGTTALGTREVVATPLDTLFTGVEVQATVADNLLQQDSVHRPSYAVALETEVTFGLGIALVLLVRRKGVGWGAAATAASLVIVWGTAVFLMSATSMFVSPLFPTLGLTASLGAMTVAGFAIERRRADHADQETDASRRLMVQTLLSLTETRDSETGGHSRRTEQYARVLAGELAKHPAYSGYLTLERITMLARLAPLHDIGKVGVPDRLLLKQGSLTDEELAEIRRHPAYGRDVIAQAERQAGVHGDAVLAMAKEIIYTHHEWWDGGGYPQGLKGTDIPIAGRIMALVDVYDAVLTRRRYASPRSHDETVALIVSRRGTQFDPAVVEAFVAVSSTLRALSEAAGEYADTRR
ncbi:MAG TPA: CHASE2 domain-containing protein [Vicinamibacterales bacterium]|nr:CHASE2 domain-containing protein [Vicinamibacterales bacterium]